MTMLGAIRIFIKPKTQDMILKTFISSVYEYHKKYLNYIAAVIFYVWRIIRDIKKKVLLSYRKCHKYTNMAHYVKLSHISLETYSINYFLQKVVIF